MKGHESARGLLRDYLAAYVPLRLALIRDDLATLTPADPAVYLLADGLPDNDPTRYPAVVVMSSRTVGMTRRRAASDGDLAIYDVDYEITVIVACERSEYVADEQASVDRDRLMLAVRECLILPVALDDTTTILATPAPAEQTGAASQTLRGNPIAAGTITCYLRAMEVLIPNATLVDLIEAAVEVDAYDAGQQLPTPN